MSPPDSLLPHSTASAAPASLLHEGLGASVDRHLRGYFAAHKGQLPASGLYERVLREVERPLLELALNACNGNQIKAAQLLGLNRNTLRSRLQQHGIKTRR